MNAFGYRRFAAASAGILWGAVMSPAIAGPDVVVNADAAGTVQNEVRITRNAASPGNLVAAYNDGSGAASSPLGISYSTDTGATWSDVQLGVPTHPFLGTPDDGLSLGIIFDPFIDSDSLGNVYAGHIATDGSLGGPGGIYIERSTDGGATWSGPINIDFNVRALPPGGPDPAYRFNDRPDMTVDASDNLYVVWIKDVGVGLPTSDIYFSKSPPPPLDFTGLGAGSIAPKTINDFPNGFDEANVPDVAVAGSTVYVSWIDVNVTNPNPKPATLMLDVSLDGGATFGPDILVLGITALGNHLSTTAAVFPAQDDARSGSYPVIALDPGDATAMTVYMAFAADPQGAADPAGTDEADIFFIKSTDGGLTWSAPLRVNDDATVTDQFHPMMAVKPDGTIDIAWYDKRNAANDDQWDVYLAKSTDGGASFASNVRVSDQSFSTPVNAPGTEPWLGEYLGLEVDSTFAYIAFTSGLNDSRGDIFFDRISNSPQLQVVIDIKPGSDPNAINPNKSRGLVPVAILTTDVGDGDPLDFDATTVDPSTVEFAGASIVHAAGHIEDVDSDGDLDLVLHFRVQETTIACGDIEAMLTGATFGGQAFAGTDSVKTVACN